LIASDIPMVASICDVADSRFSTFAKKFWPGPLTLILPGTDRSKSYAIRVSSHPVARQLAEAFGSPIVSTSANRSGQEPVIDSDLLPETMKKDLAVIVKGGTLAGGLPSTIVSLLERPGKVIRQGAIPATEIISFI
jgi:L-threonylcarbamoyladenylate synthase